MTDSSLSSRSPRRAQRAWLPGRAPAGLARVAQLALLIILAGIVLVPLVATALGGFKELGDLRANPFGLPKVWVWSNYWDILSGSRYWQVLGNSLLIALLTVALTLVALVDGGFHLRASAFLRRPLPAELHAARPAVSRRRRRSCRCSSRSATSGLLDSHWGIVLPQVAFALGDERAAAAQRASSNCRANCSTRR